MSAAGPRVLGMSRAGPPAGRLSVHHPEPQATTARAPGRRGNLSLPSADGPDILWQNTVTGDRSIWDMEGTSYGGHFALLPNVPVAWRMAGTGDFDADGSQDILWQNTSTGEASIWLMDGASYNGRNALLPTVATDWKMAGVGDFNGDGKPDIVWQNLANGMRSVWLMNGTTYNGSNALFPTVAIDWEIAAVGDMSADGKPDLVWQNRYSGERSVWFMDGTAYNGQFAALPTVPMPWRIAAAADFNRNGHNDLLWENRSTQERSIWLMQRASWDGSYAMLPNVNADWQMAGAGWFFGARQSSCAPPAESYHHTSYTAFWRAPYGFRGATPWLSVVQASGNSAASTVEIDYIRLMARIGGVPQIISENSYSDGVQPGGQLWARSPWFGGTAESMPGTVSGGILTIRPGDRADRVWHPFLNTPMPAGRRDISGADSVWIEIRVRITGPALVQAGLDYWQNLTTDSSPNRIMEAAASDWVCANGGWQTLTIGRSTEVVVPLELTTSTGTFTAGTPITGTVTYRNFDDDPIRLEGMGIEVRKKAAGNDLCDPSANPELVSAFPWRLNFQVGSGETVRQTGTWTPSAGTYCLIVVEKRPYNPYYQRPYLPESSRTLVVN
ncbi:MAG TPA: VCBS repeat-containing protein [Longimicrobium sp.]|nr:VCBS repeat-containing protein [Longimicrobium sp.]